MTGHDELVHELRVELQLRNEELQRSQLEAQAACTRYLELFQLAPTGYLTLGDRAAILEANLAAAALFDAEPEHLVGTKLTALLARKDADAFYLMCREIIETGQRRTLEVELHRPALPVCYVRLDAVSATRITGRGEECFRVALIDVTAQRIAEAELHQLLEALESRVRERTAALERAMAERLQVEAEQRRTDRLLHLIADAMPARVAYVDRDQRVRFVNQRYQMSLGKASGELQGKPLVEVLDPATYALATPHIDKVLAGEPTSFESAVAGPEDQPGWTLTRYAPDCNRKGRVRGFVALLTDITERKQIEQVRADSELFYRQTLESIPGMVFITGPDGFDLYASRQWAEYTGIPAHEIVGQGWLQLLHPADREDAVAAWRSAIAGRTAYDLEYRVRRHDGAYQWFRAVARPIRDQSGQIARWFGVATNVDELKRVDAERETVVEFLRLVNDSTGAADLVRQATDFFHRTFDCDAVGIRLRSGADYPWAATRGFSVDHVVSGNHLCAHDTQKRPVLDSADNPILACLCGSVIAGRSDPLQPFFTDQGSFFTNHASELPATAGDELPDQLWGRCLYQGYESIALVALRSGIKPLGLIQLCDRRAGWFAAGSVALWEGFANHLAGALSRFAAEEALLQSRADLARAQAVGQIGSWRLDVRDDLLVWSDQNYRIFGVPLGTPMRYQDFLAIVHPDDRDEVNQQLAAGLPGGPYDVEHRIVVGDQVRWVREKAYLEVDGSGQLRGGFGITQEITERKAAEAALRDSEARYQRLFETMVEKVQLWRVIQGDGGRIETLQLVDANPATLAAWGQRSADEIKGKIIHQLLDPEVAERYCLIAAEIVADGTSRSFESYSAHTDRHYRLTSVPLGDHILTTGADITEEKRTEQTVRAQSLAERKRLEEGLRQAQKMEAVGRLAAGVSHDINNLLMGVDGCAEMALRRLDTDHPARPYLEQIASAVTSGAATTRQLLSFSRRRTGQTKLFDLGVCVAGCERLLHRLVGDDIELMVDRDNAACLIQGDDAGLEQALINLAVNARHAMPSGGRLSIEIRNRSLDAAELAGRPDVAAGQYVALVVSDTGCGMPEEVQKHVFEPFFTTRSADEGTGLGLATTYATVKQAGGHITMTSQEGQGTRFEILLPRARGVLEPALPPTAPEHEPPPTHERVLLVEDDRLVRTSVCHYLEEAGYRVLEASSAAEAIALCDRATEPIDLLVTDIVLSGHSGTEVARELTTRMPELGVIYTSAHPQEWLEQTKRLAPGTAVLNKPFSREQLLVRVRMVLAQNRTPVAGPPTATRPATHPPEVAADRDPSLGDRPATARTVLVVGDCDPTGSSLHDHLSRAGWRVLVAMSGRAALRTCFAAAHEIDAVLIDYSLPDMNGDSLARELRLVAPEVLLVYLSGYPDLELNPVGRLLVKPVEVDAILCALEATADGSSSR